MNRLTKDMRFVSKIDTIAHGIVHFSSAQIGRDTFEEFFAELGDVLAFIIGTKNPKDLLRLGPQLSYPAFKRSAIERGTWEVRDDKGGAAQPGPAQRGFIAELERLTMVAYPTDGGLRQIPLGTAFAQGVLDEDDRSEVLSEIIFFTAISRAAEKRIRDSILLTAGIYRGWAYISETFSEYLASLKASSAPANTKRKASSVIS